MATPGLLDETRLDFDNALEQVLLCLAHRFNLSNQRLLFFRESLNLGGSLSACLFCACDARLGFFDTLQLFLLCVLQFGNPSVQRLLFAVTPLSVSFRQLASLLLGAHAAFRFFDSFQMLGFGRAHSRDLSLERLCLLNPLRSFCLELYANGSQLSQPLLLLFRATSCFGFGLAVRFFLNAKTSVGFLDALALGFFVLA